MRHILIVLCMLFGLATSANAQLNMNISFGIPGLSIGINLGEYPEFVQVPDYPVYYAPRLNSNFFFYDGLYWVYQRDEWYASSWYNGPWGMVDRLVVPYYVLRVPVRYYRDPPQYFRGWREDAPPRWGQHWGNQWQERRRGWDQWDRKAVPRPAPLPVYQRQYSGDRYPQLEQQHQLRTQNYRYQPREAVVQRSYEARPVQKAPQASERREQGTSQEKGGGRQEGQRVNPAPPQQGNAPAPRSQPPQRAGEDIQKSAPTQAPAQQRGAAIPEQSRQPQQGSGQREQQSPRANQENNPQDKGASKDSRRRQDQDKDKDKDREKGDGKGQDRNK